MKVKEMREWLVGLPDDAEIDAEGTYRIFAIERAYSGWRNEYGDGEPVYTFERDDEHDRLVLVLSINE